MNKWGGGGFRQVLNRHCWRIRLTEAPSKAYHITVQDAVACIGVQDYHTQFIEPWGEASGIGNESRVYARSHIWLLLSSKLFYLRMKGPARNLK